MGIRTRGVNVGEPSIDKQYMNIRAELHWKMRKWIKDGGMIENDPKLIKELLQLRFRRNLRNQIQIMSKDDMKKNGWQSPNKSDALMLTFYVDFDKQKLNAPKNIPTMPQEADTYD